MLEVIGFNIESCKDAQSAGAGRIELCDSPADGGTTPSYGMIKRARQILSIDLFCMIRPRGGDFFYSDAEFEVMKSDIEMCKQLGCDGVVFGLLEKDGTIDLDRTEDLVELAYPMETTFHRAFDRCHDPLGSMEEIISIGCTRILTSGQKPTVMEGINLIAMLVEKAHERIIIMPGSGIRSDNIEAISKQTGATEFHSSARIIVRSEMEMLNAAMNETLTTTGIDTDEIKKMVARLKK